MNKKGGFYEYSSANKEQGKIRRIKRRIKEKMVQGIICYFIQVLIQG